jgi:nucleoside-diphosphate-sugar epimerase
MAQLSRDVVLVTGSSGFIGSAAVETLASRYTVVGLDSHIPPRPPPVAECVCVDLTSGSSVEAAFKRVRIGYGTRIASVIHLAAYFDLTGEPNPVYDKVTVQGTGRLLAALQEFDVEQFVFSSTILVHAAGRPAQKIK